MNLRLSRRELLATTGASALLLPLLNHGRAYAADPVFSKRIIFVVTGNGTIERAFWPKVSGNSLALGEITSPLEPHKAKLLFTKGVDMKVWAQDNPFGGNGDAHHNFGANPDCDQACDRRSTARASFRRDTSTTSRIDPVTTIATRFRPSNGS